MPAAVDLKDRDFGWLTVIRKTSKRVNGGKIVWVCLCNPALGGCGKILALPSTTLLHKGQVSCGCFRAVAAAERLRGNKPTPERRYSKCCRHCGERYKGTKRQRYCKPNCRRAARIAMATAQRIQRSCAFCGKPVPRRKSQAYCTPKCRFRAVVARRNAAIYAEILTMLGES